MMPPCLRPDGTYNTNICVAEGCYGMVCETLKLGDDRLIRTTVEPLFGKTFVAQGNYEPTRWEKLFGNRIARFWQERRLQRNLRYPVTIECDCSAHDITVPGMAHAVDCPMAD